MSRRWKCRLKNRPHGCVSHFFQFHKYCLRQPNSRFSISSHVRQPRVDIGARAVQSRPQRFNHAERAPAPRVRARARPERVRHSARAVRPRPPPDARAYDSRPRPTSFTAQRHWCSSTDLERKSSCRPTSSAAGCRCCSNRPTPFAARTFVSLASTLALVPLNLVHSASALQSCRTRSCASRPRPSSTEARPP
jgi:hypothetical protein